MEITDECGATLMDKLPVLASFRVGLLDRARVAWRDGYTP